MFLVLLLKENSCLQILATHDGNISSLGYVLNSKSLNFPLKISIHTLSYYYTVTEHCHYYRLVVLE